MTVCSTLAIDVQPADTPVSANGTATLTVHANGNGLQYQWYNATTGQAISGATSTSYTTPVLTQTTFYYVVVSSSSCGSIQSRTARVCAIPAFDVQPADTPVSGNGTATLTVHANGTGVQYQWYTASGQAISGATSTSYTTPVLTQTTSYYVVASSSCGTSATSRVAAVTVSCTAPSLSSQPSTTVVVYGNTTTLIANATGTSLHYHWYVGFAPDTSFPVGTDSPFYTTAAVTYTSHYWVQVTNSCGMASGSTLTVTPVSAPASVSATYYDATHVLLQWPAATSAVQYRIMRRESGFTLRPMLTLAPSVLSTIDTVPNNLEFLYCVQAIDSRPARRRRAAWQTSPRRGRSPRSQAVNSFSRRTISRSSTASTPSTTSPGRHTSPGRASCRRAFPLRRRSHHPGAAGCLAPQRRRRCPHSGRAEQRCQRSRYRIHGSPVNSGNAHPSHSRAGTAGGLQ